MVKGVIIMSKRFKWNMLISSFLPLWVSIVLIDLWTIIKKTMALWNNEISFRENFLEVLKENTLPIIFTILVSTICIISCIRISRFLKNQKKCNNSYGRITNIRKKSNLSADFLIAYVLPMLVFDFTSLLHIILFALYFATLAFLSIRNNHVYINIFLEFNKYKLYTADIECKITNTSIVQKECLIISKNDLTGANNEKIIFYDFDKKIYIDLTEENNDTK